jgi:hypothetical protein
MSKASNSARDPKLDPQPGDKLYKLGDAGKHLSRQVVRREDNDIFYVTHHGKERKCWISTWLEWARMAEVECE